MSEAWIGRGEERGPDDGADKNIVVEAEGAAVADGGGCNGEHGEECGDGIEVEGYVGVGEEIAQDGGEAREDDGSGVGDGWVVGHKMGVVLVKE